MKEEMWLRGTGAAIPGLNSSNVKELPIPQIPSEVVKEDFPLFDEVAASIHACAREATTLSRLRDTLLPELLSGRIRVPEAHELIEDAP
jgi:type I restriction enzyme S subunit